MSVIMRFGANSNSSVGFPLPARIRAAVRRCIAEEVERLVDMLDALDGDPDAEDCGDGEPFLGWTTTMTWGTTDDREVKVTTPV